jgi:hypothetical protein
MSSVWRSEDTTGLQPGLLLRHKLDVRPGQPQELPNLRLVSPLVEMRDRAPIAPEERLLLVVDVPPQRAHPMIHGTPNAPWSSTFLVFARRRSFHSGCVVAARIASIITWPTNLLTSSTIFRIILFGNPGCQCTPGAK